MTMEEDLDMTLFSEEEKLDVRVKMEVETVNNSVWPITRNAGQDSLQKDAAFAETRLLLLAAALLA